MKLRGFFQSILEKIKFNRILGNKRILIMIGSGIAAIIFICIAFWGKNKLDYLSDEKKLLMTYQEQLESYNELVSEYNELNDGLLERELITSKSDLVIKENPFLSSSSIDANDVDNEKKQLEQDDEELRKKYKDLCIGGYNKVVLECNEEYGKFNSIIDKIGEYAALIGADKKVDKQNIDEIMPEWQAADIYLTELDKVIDEINDTKNNTKQLTLEAGNEIISDYEIVMEEYNSLVKNAVIEYIEGVPNKVDSIDKLEIEKINDKTYEQLNTIIDDLITKQNELIANYLVVKQIIAPSEEWVKQRISEVSYVDKIEAVTKNNDPNGLLGKDGGYTSCVYFSVRGIKQNDIPGNSVVDKGTDAGGAIEVYDTKEAALNRCDYLSQFDGTLLYSGSYTAIGTMVVRTSYKLNDEQQIKLTNFIIQNFTEVR